MKKFKVLALILTLAMTLNLVAPVAYASEITNDATVQLNNVVTNGDYSISGVENSTVRYNIIINNSDQTGQFAIVYLDSPDYMYEYCFTLNEVSISHPDNIWEDVQTHCFDNESNWTEVYLPEAVVSEEAVQNDSIVQPYATADDVEYFENWLTDKYGDEYSGRLLSTKTQNGTTMYLKSGFQAYAYKDQTYRLAQTLTVVGFVTGILGLAAGATAVGVIGAIAGTGGMLFLGQSVYKYTVRANWFRYVTLSSGTGYPYGLSDKFIFYTGYSYSETGTCNVDEASASTSYIPSSSVYNSYTNIFNAAYDEYQQIGWQEGNF